MIIMSSGIDSFMMFRWYLHIWCCWRLICWKVNASKKYQFCDDNCCIRISQSLWTIITVWWGRYQSIHNRLMSTKSFLVKWLRVVVPQYNKTRNWLNISFFKSLNRMGWIRMVPIRWFCPYRKTSWKSIDSSSCCWWMPYRVPWILMKRSASWRYHVWCFVSIGGG
jgi:hypothetical protein